MQAIGHSKEAGKNVPLISPSHWARMAMLGLLVTLSAKLLSMCATASSRNFTPAQRASRHATW